MGPPGQKGSVGEMGIPGKNTQLKHAKCVSLKCQQYDVCMCVCVNMYYV